MRHTNSIQSHAPLSSERLESLLPKWVGICQEAPVLLLYLHGSYAKGTPSPLSDIDLAVLLESHCERDYRVYGELSSAFEDTCGRDDIDLVILNMAGPIIRDRVVRYGRLLYAREDGLRVEFEAQALKSAMDFDYFSRVYDQALFQQLQMGRIYD